MFYYLYTFLNINLFQYTTVRAGFAFFIAFVFTIFFMPKFIRWAKQKHADQPIYELAPKSHQTKNKTPTMGGLVFIFSTIIASLLCARLDNFYVIASILCLFLFCSIGFIDDYNKIIKNSNHAGLTPKGKFTLQILFAFVVSIVLLTNGANTELFVPFYKYSILNMEFFSVVFWVVVIVASSNAVNLTDGLDGLATVPSIFALLSLSVFSYLSGHIVFSNYLFLPSIQGLGEVIIVTCALMGALIGFLWFNCYPAEVFMGDSGSLSMGSFIGLVGIMSKNEFLLIIIGFVFVMETVSVILQVGSFKIFKKRIFLMAPIHHHFEIKGWVENKIIIRFWLIALLANLVALTALKLR
ncbi:phospho-N-acetylmuramoyl-pentapeptide-transferase [Campylobacter sputorum]|uniref:phospho-N-acetylmuramoyl-pentapeptide- transferase n=1 Tax=Campylobacter sputorum TaxID=206 RepID=UPI000B777108|nr:phospho-N-acetylmuramoyl-pentapeptide-transferase [Campylobacter sputorum]ASM36800.1 phospho-N-acetylmuramoyl-pentapeptide transferase [Campylobacter sputorum bv. faecalis CCUG 20703]